VRRSIGKPLMLIDGPVPLTRNCALLEFDSPRKGGARLRSKPRCRIALRCVVPPRLAGGQPKKTAKLRARLPRGWKSCAPAAIAATGRWSRNSARSMSATVLSGGKRRRWNSRRARAKLRLTRTPENAGSVLVPGRRRASGSSLTLRSDRAHWARRSAEIRNRQPGFFLSTAMSRMGVPQRKRRAQAASANQQLDAEPKKKQTGSVLRHRRPRPRCA